MMLGHVTLKIVITKPDEVGTNLLVVTGTVGRVAGENASWPPRDER